MHKLEEVFDCGGPAAFVLAGRRASMVQRKAITNGGCADVLEAKVWCIFCAREVPSAVGQHVRSRRWLAGWERKPGPKNKLSEGAGSEKNK
jgi:hypothetical protein